MTLLSVLDQSPVRAGGTPIQALRETIELAQHTDRLGYHRYWLSEHHNTSGLASATPEILIAEIAMRTERIRVGSGGVMLTHYSPLKVAEQFRMLEALHPGRIDLGVGRAPGSDTKTARALAHGPGQLPLDAYPDQLLDLYGYLSDDLPEGHLFRGIKAIPETPTMPELWVLGSSLASAQYAAELGWAFCFAHFINPEGGERAVQMYRDRFQPSPSLKEPRASIGISATVAETDEQAEYLSWSRWCWRIAANHGERRGIPSPEDAMAFPYTPPEREYIEYMKTRSIYGSPERVRGQLDRVGAAYGVDEYVLVTITHDFEARKHSYTLLARAYGLDVSEATP
ncbi:MAG: LLM class flavin-dependent oxidoreductase [Dehalococcoidia bacterium]